MQKSSRSKHGERTSDRQDGGNRRNFLRETSLLVAGGTVASVIPVPQDAFAYGQQPLKVGLIGCGGRGTAATIQALDTEGPVQVVALCDLFEKRIAAAYRAIKGKHADRIDVPDERRFLGMDGYRRLLDTDVDIVLLATPPGFRPLHFEAAVDSGKHIFMEKPVATDPPGIRRILAANEQAKKKGLAVQVGFQRRHQSLYKETIRRLQEGMIGDILYARAYWNGAGVWVRQRDAKQSELEYQINNWYYFNWLSGDHIVEQHVHNLDVINWLMKAHPIEAQGQGGRQVRTGKETGEIFDHHFVEFTYPNGAKLISQCRQIPGCWNSISEFAHGVKGWSEISAGKIYDHDGKLLFHETKNEDGWAQEQVDFFAALRRGERPNEVEQGAMSTMTAIMGRLATYSGAKLSWENCFQSKLSLANLEGLKDLDSAAPVGLTPNGDYSIPVPGSERKRFL